MNCMNFVKVHRRGGVHGNSHDPLRVRVSDGIYTQTNYCMVDTYAVGVGWVPEENEVIAFDYAATFMTSKKEEPSYHMCLVVHYDQTERDDMCFLKRGEHPISTIYWYAHSPYQEVEFVIEDEHY